MITIKNLAKYGYTQDVTGAGKLKTDIDTAANKSTAVTDVDGGYSGLLDNVDSMIKSVLLQSVPNSVLFRTV